MAEFSKLYIESRLIDEYATPQLCEPSRPPSRGGNGKALHRHAFRIDSTWYSFFAAGSKKWIFKNDVVRFQFEAVEKDGRVFNNVKLDTLQVLDSKGIKASRGGGTYAKKRRTSETRLPVSRREARD